MRGGLCEGVVCIVYLDCPCCWCGQCGVADRRLTPPHSRVRKLPRECLRGVEVGVEKVKGGRGECLRGGMPKGGGGGGRGREG